MVEGRSVTGHVFCVGTALTLIVSPLVFALVGAYREKRKDNDARKPRREPKYRLGGAR